MAALLTGTGALARAHLQAAWRELALFGAMMSGLVVSVGVGVGALFPTAADRRDYAESAGASPGVAAFNGRGYDLTETGALVGFEVGLSALVGFPVLAIHLAIRLTRHEEDAGRTELVTAGRVGRLAPLAAAALVVAACLAGFVLAAGGGLTAVGLPAAGSVRYAVSLGLFAAAFAALGLLAAQVSREARAAYALGLTAVVATYLVRAVVDGRDGSATWLSPSGWLAEVRPWGPWRWWPLAAFAGLTLVCLLLAAVVALRRDVRGGLVAARRGPAYARASLGTPWGLAWRFTRAPLVGWLVGTATWNAAFGALAGEMTDLAASSPGLLEAMGVERPEHLLTSLALLLCGVGASAFGVQAVARLAHEEDQGRLAHLLSTRVPRSRLWLAWLGVALTGAAGVLLVSALCLALLTAWSTGDRAGFGDTLRGGLALLLPVAAVVALAGALQGCLPRWTVAAWAAVGWAAVVGLLGETLRLPGWLRDVSPLHAAGRVPVEQPHPEALVLIGLLAVALLAVGLRRFRRRELAGA